MGKHQFTRNITVKNDGNYRRNYNQHDDRDAPSISNRGRGSSNRVWRKGDSRGRHVSFNDRGQSNRGGIRKRTRGGAGNVRSDIILDDDVGMESRGHQAGRARPQPGSLRGRGRGRGRGGRGGVHVSGSYVIRRNHDDGSGGWHKVLLLNASRYSKEDVLSALLNAHPSAAPLCFSKQGMNFVFYVETRQQANALANLDKQISLVDGSQLNIRADPSAPPHMTLTDESMDKIKTVMSSRYNPPTKALNLKAFHNDRAFIGESVYAPLYRGACMKRVINIIQENIPELEALDLSDNRLAVLDAFSSAIDKIVHLKILYMSNNKISDIKELACLQGLKLDDLNVEGNPFVSRYMDHDHLVRNLRKIFPTLKTLNGKPLPKVIGFEGEDDVGRGSLTSLPPPQMKMIVNVAAEPTILKFVQEYFRIYDSPSREPLMHAYHEEAKLSMHCAYPPYKIEGADKLHEYMSRSRNLTRIQDPTKKRTMLRQGKLAIVSFLTELPKSQHDLNSFTLDAPLATESLINVTVTGVFRETEERTPVIRHFARTFVVVPHNEGFCIVNETMFITVATRWQIKTAFTDVAAGAAAASTSTSSPPATVDAATMAKMIEALSQKTGMNADWSKRCLGETNWNFDNALTAFKTACNEGKIPIEAYEK